MTGVAGERGLHPQASERRAQRLLSGLINLIDSLPALLAAEGAYRSMLQDQAVRGLAPILRGFAARPDFVDGRKYLNMHWYLRDSIARAMTLGVHRAAPMRIADLGCGPGYFLLACRRYGHAVVGLDMPGNEFYAALIRHFALPRVESRIQAFAPLEGLDGQFDLITAFSVTFDKIRGAGQARDWEAPEWGYFLADIRRFMAPGGRLFLRLNHAEIRGLRDPRRLEFFQGRQDRFAGVVRNRRDVCLTAV
jgi:SAM-dependent methyltransferase